MSFKLFTPTSVFGSDPDDEMPSVRPDPRHHVFIFDRSFSNFRDDLSEIVRPLKFCLLLAVHVAKHGTPKSSLPTVAIMVIYSYLLIVNKHLKFKC